jgi:outer membrane murein-binding lipoprotein Lpp
MRQLKLAAVIVAMLVLAACPNNPKPQTLPPGALNQFDATSYTSLMGAQAVLNSVKADIDKLPPDAKPTLNRAIASYNIAEAAWQAYHAGKSDDQATLTKAISQAVGDVATLLTQVSGGKK